MYNIFTLAICNITIAEFRLSNISMEIIKIILSMINFLFKKIKNIKRNYALLYMGTIIL